MPLVAIATSVGPSQAPMFHKRFPVNPDGTLDKSLAYPEGRMPGIPSWISAGSRSSAMIEEVAPTQNPSTATQAGYFSGFAGLRAPGAGFSGPLGLTVRQWKDPRDLPTETYRRASYRTPDGVNGFGYNPPDVPGFLGTASTIATIVSGLQPVLDTLAVALTAVGIPVAAAIPVVNTLLGGMHDAFVNGKIDPALKVILNDQKFQAIWALLNGLGRGISGDVGNVADVIAILGVIAGIPYFVQNSPKLAAAVNLWLATHRPGFPTGTVSQWDPTVSMYRNYAPQANILSWWSGGGLAGFGATAPVPPASLAEVTGKSPTVTPGGPIVAGGAQPWLSANWKWLAGIGGALALGTGTYYLLK